MLHCLRQAVDADDRHRVEGGGLAGVCRRQQQLAHRQPGAELGDRQTAADRPDGAVETELAAEDPSLEAVRRQLPMRRQQRQRDRQVEVIAGLAQVRRRQVDDLEPRLQAKAAVAHRRAHPLAALAHGGVRQADDVHSGQAVLQIDLDVDRSGVDAPRGSGGGAGQHRLDSPRRS